MIKINIGDKLSFSNREWQVVEIKRGSVYLVTAGLSKQSVNWLYCYQMIEKGSWVKIG